MRCRDSTPGPDGVVGADRGGMARFPRASVVWAVASLRMKRSVRGVLAATLCTGSLLVAGTLAVPGWAQATPSEGISGVTWVDIEVPSGLLPFVPDGVHAVAREITIAPGGTTGWHHHDGPVLGIVRAGTLTHPGADCAPVIFPTGSLIDEPPGPDHMHVGRNLGAVPVILDVVYLVPIGAPLFEDVPAPACDAP